MIEALLPVTASVMKNYPASGPGNKTLIKGNEDIGYFGEVDVSLIITHSALKTHLGLATGNLGADACWFKFMHKGVVKFVSKKCCWYNVTWNALYAAGGIYGTNDNGVYPAATPKNQRKPLQVPDGSLTTTLIPKLVSGSAIEPTGITAADITAANNEYSDLLYRIITGTHANAAAFASYAKTAVSMDVAHAVVETIKTNTAQSLIRGYGGAIGEAGQALGKTDPSGYAQWCRMVLVVESSV